MRRKYKSSLTFGYSSRRKKSKIKIIIIFIVCIAIGWGVFLFFNGVNKTKEIIFNSSNEKKNNISKEIKVNKKENLTKIKKNKKSIATTPKNVKKRDYMPLKKDLEKFIKKTEGTWGIYFKNINGNEEFGINDDIEYQAASTIKVPINYMMFELVAQGKEKLETKVVYEYGDKEGGTGRIQYSQIGTEYTLRELSRFALTESDNVAINMISKHFGKAKVYKEFMRTKGAKLVDLNRNVTSPRDLGLFLSGIYQFSKENPKLGKELLNNMKDSEPKDRLQRLLPKNVEVAHKVGNYIRSYHDVGIFFTKRPYVLCVMSQNVGLEKESYDIIAKISKRVFDYSKNLEKLDEKDKEKKLHKNRKKNI